MKDVPSHHDFFDPAYVREWARRAQQNRPERKKFFRAFVAELQRLERDKLLVLELGPGPGFLAEELLESCSVAEYYLFDFSPPMLDLCRARLRKFERRTVFVQGNFRRRGWFKSLPNNFDAIVSLQSVHELRHAGRIPRLYAGIYRLLASGGLFLICDHVNSRMAARYREAHFMTVDEHIAALEGAGFLDVGEVCAAGDLSLIKGRKA